MIETRLRWLRATLLAVVSLLTGSLAHLSADGRLPGTTGLVLLFVVLTLGCGPLLAARASCTRVVLLLMGGQTFIHLGLTAMAGHGTTPTTSTVLATPTPGAHASLTDLMPQAAPATLAVPSWVTEEIAMLTGPHAFMALAHLAAAALIGLWLATGEAALFAVLALAVGAVLRLLVALPVPPLPKMRPTHLPVVRRANAHPRQDPKRGPPRARLSNLPTHPRPGIPTGRVVVGRRAGARLPSSALPDGRQTTAASRQLFETRPVRLLVTS